MMLKKLNIKHYLVFVGAMIVCGITAQLFKLDIALLVATCALAFAVEKDRSIVSVQPKQVVMPMEKVGPDHYGNALGEVMKKDDGWHVHFRPTKTGYGPFSSEKEAVVCFSNLAGKFLSEGESI